MKMKKAKKQEFTSKVIKMRGDERDYSEHLRRRMKLELITKMLRSPQDWIARLALDAPDKKPEDFYKALKEQRDKLFEAERKYTEKQRSKLKIPNNPSYRLEYLAALSLDQLLNRGLPRVSPWHRLTILSGVALPNSFLNYHVVWPARGAVVNDWYPSLTESKVEFYVQLYNGASYLYFPAEAFDTLGVLVWDFPPPPDKAEGLQFEGRFKLRSGCNITGYYGKVQLNCIYCGQTRASTAPSASEYQILPSSFVFEHSVDPGEETYYFSGLFGVEAGVVSRLYIGCRVAFVAWDGEAETVDANFEIRAQPGDDWFETVPGIKYTYYWYPGRSGW
jgi:hypothetical protein